MPSRFWRLGKSWLVWLAPSTPQGLLLYFTFNPCSLKLSRLPHLFSLALSFCIYQSLWPVATHPLMVMFLSPDWIESWRKPQSRAHMRNCVSKVYSALHRKTKRWFRRIDDLFAQYSPEYKMSLNKKRTIKLCSKMPHFHTISEYVF